MDSVKLDYGNLLLIIGVAGVLVVMVAGLYYIKTTNDVTREISIKQENVEKNILGNLTAHRLVANATRDQVLELENQTNILLKGLEK
jgi:hypothetical protein